MRGSVLVLLSMLAGAAPALAAAPFAKSDLYRYGRQSSKGGDFARAAAAFEDMIRAEAGRQTLQLAVVCERETIARLVDAAESEEGFYFVAASVHGRECYRALWGVFGTADSARAAVTSLPAELRDGKSPPVAVAVDTLLAGERPGPAPPAAGGTAASTRAAPPARPAGPKVFTDSDLSGYRKSREEDERKYGKPKALFEEEDPSRPPSGKRAAAEPPKTTIASSPEPGSGEKGYWTSLFRSASETVREKRGALAAAERTGDPLRARTAREELSQAEKAMEDLRERALARGADPAWLK